MESHLKFPGFESLTHGTHKTSCGSEISFHASDPNIGGRPVLLLVHGWPQRYVHFECRARSQWSKEMLTLYVAHSC